MDINVDVLKKILGVPDDGDDDDVNAAMVAFSISLQQKLDDASAALVEKMQAQKDADLAENKMVQGRRADGAIVEAHKDSNEAKQLHALSAGIVTRLCALTAAAMALTPLEREVMRRLNLTPGQWLCANAGTPGAVKTLNATHGGLITLQAPVSLAGAELPSRIVMLKWGDNETAQGPVSVGNKTFAAAALWPGLGFGEVVIDFNHNSVVGHASYQGEPVAVAARQATLSVVPGEGLIFDKIEWTDEGRKNRQFYPDLSPAVKCDEAGEVIFCHSAALARNGAVTGLHLLSAASTPPALAAKLLTLSASLRGHTGRAAASPITGLEREVMQNLGLTEAQWLRAGHSSAQA